MIFWALALLAAAVCADKEEALVEVVALLAVDVVVPAVVLVPTAVVAIYGSFCYFTSIVKFDLSSKNLSPSIHILKQTQLRNLRKTALRSLQSQLVFVHFGNR